MNALVVDTSSWISYFAGAGEKAIDEALREGRVYLSSIVAAELMSGKLRSSDERKLVGFFRELPLCDSSLDHWVRVGRLRARLLERRLKISTPDAHIAQCAIDLNCFLLTEDRVFSKVAKGIGLRLYETP